MYAAFALSAWGCFPFAQRLATTPAGSSWFLAGQWIYGLFLLAAVLSLSLPVLACSLCYRRTRQPAFVSLMLVLGSISCCKGGSFLGQTTRRAGMQAFAQRSHPLVNAIRQYENDHETPPVVLDDLVPLYLEGIPTTSMAAYPEYRSVTGDAAREQYAGNPWALSVFTPSGLINFDRMLYLPKQNYPDLGRGSALEPIGDWACNHE